MSLKITDYKLAEELGALEGASLDIKAGDLVRERLGRLALSLGEAPAPEDLPLGEALAALQAPLAQLLERAELRSVREGETRNEGDREQISRARHSLYNLSFFVAKLEQHSILPSAQPGTQEAPDESVTMMLLAICTNADDLAERVAALAASLGAAEAERAAAPGAAAVTRELAELGKPRANIESTSSPAAEDLKERLSREGPGAVPTLSVGFNDLRKGSRQVASLEQSYDPALHEHLLVCGAYAVLGTDGTMAAVEGLLRDVPEVWTGIEAGSAISYGEVYQGDSDIRFALRGPERQKPGVPVGRQLVAVELRDEHDRPIEGSGAIISHSTFGPLHTEPPEEARSLVVRVGNYGPERAPTSEMARELGERLPRPSAPLDAFMASAIERALREPSLELRAQIVAQAFKAQGLVYTLAPELGELIESSRDCKLALLNGLNCGSCITLSFQLATYLNQAGVPALVIDGPFLPEGGEGYRGAPGHAQVLCYTPASLVLDPTTWCDGTRGIDGSVMEPGELAYYKDAITDMSPKEAYDLGRELRQRMEVAEPINRSQDGHSLRDGLEHEPRAEVKALIELSGLEKRLPSVWEIVQERSFLPPLTALFARTRDLMDGYLGASEELRAAMKPCKLLIDAAVSCAADSSFDDDQLAELAVEIAGLQNRSGMCDGTLLSFFEACLAREPISEKLAREVTRGLALSFNISNHWRGGAIERTADLFLRALDNMIENTVNGEYASLLDEEERNAFAMSYSREMVKMHLRLYADLAGEIGESYRRALVSRFDAVTRLAGITSEQLLFQPDEDSGLVQGEIRMSWLAILSESGRFGRDFRADGTLSPELNAKAAARIALHVERGDYADLALVLGNLSGEGMKLDLSSARARVTAALNPSESELNCPIPENPVSCLLFHSGGLPTRFDECAAALYAVGALELAELAARWPPKDEQKIAEKMTSSLADLKIEPGRMTAEVVIPTYEHYEVDGRRHSRAMGAMRTLCADLMPSLLRVAPERFARWLECEPEQAQLFSQFPDLPGPVHAALKSWKERMPESFDALCRELDMQSLYCHNRTIQLEVHAALRGLVPDYERLRFEMAEAVTASFFEVMKDQSRFQEPAKEAYHVIRNAFGEMRKLELDGGQPSALSARPEREQTLALFLAVREWRDLSDLLVERRRDNSSASEDAAAIKEHLDVLDALLDHREAQAADSAPTAELASAQEMYRSALERAEQIRAQRPPQSLFSVCLDDDRPMPSGYPYRVSWELGNSGHENAVLARFAAQYARSEGPSDEAIAEMARRFGRKIPNLSHGRDAMQLLSMPDATGKRASSSRNDAFIGHRDYAGGDDVRLIDQNVLARQDKLVVKQYGAGSQRHAKSFQLVVDAESLACDQVAPSSAAQAIFEFAVAALSTGKEVSLEITYRGQRLLSMDAKEMRRDLTVEPGRDGGGAVGAKLLGKLWRAGIDAQGVMALTAGNSALPPASILSRQWETERHLPAKKPLVVLVAPRQSAELSAQAARGKGREAALLKI